MSKQITEIELDNFLHNFLENCDTNNKNKKLLSYGYRSGFRNAEELFNNMVDKIDNNKLSEYTKEYFIENCSQDDNDFQNAMNIAVCKAFQAGYIKAKNEN